ncbi:hypothetical protein KFE25_010773 [Diacronema lutheri]|uniref:NADP-dependent oxidoreductase domain-containing protein n=1 Tax=Diacronema lutheri TaxID=2081491 RepID=A0A8J6CAQ6_DIALT|nr:hypothetical protein KFE25_010773 [Diacronema lutheri]
MRGPLLALLHGVASAGAGRVAPRAARVTMSASAPVQVTASPEALADRVRVGTLELSALGVGALNWPLDKADDEQTAQALAVCVRSGVDFVDTAEAYGFGRSEELVANCVKRLPPGARRVAVATKFAPVPWRMTASSLVDACAASAVRLGVETIDLYQIHFPDVLQPLAALGVQQRKDELYWAGLAEAYKRGLVANVGVSNYGPALLKRAKAFFDGQGVPLASNQINFSLLYRKQGAQATVDWCRDHGIAALGYFPLANGLLAGKYSASNLPSGLKGMSMRKYVVGGVVERGVTFKPGGVAPLLAEMRAVAQSRGRTVAQVALNYAMSKGVLPIPGCRNAQMAAENAGALGWRLDGGELAALEAASDGLGFEFAGGGFGLEEE